MKIETSRSGQRDDDSDDSNNCSNDDSDDNKKNPKKKLSMALKTRPAPLNTAKAATETVQSKPTVTKLKHIQKKPNTRYPRRWVPPMHRNCRFNFHRK